MTGFILTGGRLRAAYSAIAALNVAVVAVLTWERLFDLPIREYSHRLVSYRYGFIRRGLVGEVYSWFLDRVPVWLVNVEGLVAVAVAVVIGIVLFRRVVQARPMERMALACFVFGSPFLFKNLVGNNTKFDVFGAIVLMAVALLPLRLWTYAVAGGLSALLLMIHHINATLFVPAIYGVLLIRAVAARRPLGPDLAVMAVSLAGLGLVFLYLIGFSAPRLSPDAFQAAMQARSAVPLPPDQQSMWFTTLATEIGWTRDMLPAQLPRLPIFVVLAALHWPLIAFGRRRLAEAAAARPDGGLVFRLVLLTVLAGYGVTCIVAFDYARFASDFVFCLVVLATVQIAAILGPIRDAADLDAGEGRVVACAAVIAALPWVGTVFPLI